MPLTMPALFVFLEMKDYVPDTWAGRRPMECWKPQAVHPLSFLKPASRGGQNRVSWGRQGRERLRGTSYQAPHIPVHPDLTVALANPIKFFSAHDKKAVKLKEAMGGQPEVCVARSHARAPPQACPICPTMRVGADSQAQGERHLSNPLSLQSPFPLGNHPASQVNGASAPTSNGSAGTRSVSSHPSEGS